MTTLTKDDLKAISNLLTAIVRQETADLRQILEVHANALTIHSNLLSSLRSDVSQLKQAVREQGIVSEDLRDQFDIMLEIPSQPQY